MTHLYWINLDLGIDADSSDDAMTKADRILKGELKQDYTFLCHNAYRDESYTTLKKLREDKHIKREE